MTEDKSDNQSVPGAKEDQPSLPGRLASPAALALHNNFRTSMVSLKRDLVRSIHYLRVIYDRQVYRQLGFSNIRHYAAEVGGLSEAQCRAFLKIGAKLEELPDMKRALEEGALSWTKAAHIVNQATPHNEAELIGLAQQISSQKLRSNPAGSPPPQSGRPEVSAPRSQAIKPPTTPAAAPPLPPETSCYVTYKLTPEQYSIWQTAQRRQPGKTKEEHLMEILQGREPTASGSGYLIILNECPTCGRARHTNNRGTFEAPRALLETAHCDAIIEDADAKRRATMPPRIRRLVLQRDGHRCQAGGCPNTQFLQIHHRVPAAQGGTTDLDNLVTLCGRCHRSLHEQEDALRAAKRACP